MSETIETNEASSDVPPNVIFKRMADNDKKQNDRLGSQTFNSKSGKNSDPNGRTKIRFLLCTLGLLSLTTSNMSRMVLNNCITSMVDSTTSSLSNSQLSEDGSCPWPEEESSVATTTCSPSESSTSAEFQTTTKLHQLDSTTTFGPIRTFTQSTTSPSLPHITTTTTTTTTTIASETSTKNEDLDESKLDSTDEQGTTSEDVEAFLEDLTSNEPPVKEDETGVEIRMNSTEEVVIVANRFKWSIKQQSVLLGGFYYSYFVFMILGGRMAEVYGSKYVLILSVAGSAVINLATPWMANTSFELLVCSRILLGAIQSGVFPGMYALIGKWLTMSEASIYAPLIKVFLRLGMMMGTLMPGIFSDWPSVFYFTGFVCTLWSVVWLLLASSTPQENAYVNKLELEHIMKKKPKPKEEEVEEIEMSNYEKNEDRQSRPTSPVNSSKTLKTPWMKILTNPSVIGLILAKLTFNYALDFFAILLPSYLKYVHHATKEQISLITTMLFSVQVLLVVFVGWLAKYMVKAEPLGLSKTGVRKSFQAIASYGLGVILILATYNDCNLTFLGVLLQIASLASMFTAGGETMLPYDLSLEYPATIMAIANSIANVSGITITTLAGLILGDHGGSYDRWNILIRLIGGTNILGGLAFSILVKAEPIDFSSNGSKIHGIESNDRMENVVVVSKSFNKIEDGQTTEVPTEGQVSQQNGKID